MTNLAGKKLVRPRKGRWLAGVAAGFAEYLDVDVALVRVIIVVASFFGGLGILVYLAGWLLVPEEDESASIAEKFVNKNGS
jgi:phage shock protein PspC (stress-responsive transcriptional regulator)